MWHFLLAVDLLHLCTERGFHTSQGSYVLLKWPPGWGPRRKIQTRPRLAFLLPGSWAGAAKERAQVLALGKDPWESKDLGGVVPACLPEHQPCALGLAKVIPGTSVSLSASEKVEDLHLQVGPAEVQNWGWKATLGST